MPAKWLHKLMHSLSPCLKMFRVIGKPFSHPPLPLPVPVAGSWRRSRDTRVMSCSGHLAFSLNVSFWRFETLSLTNNSKCHLSPSLSHKSLLCHNNPVIKKFVHYPLWSRPFVMIAIFSGVVLATINKASVPGDLGPDTAEGPGHHNPGLWLVRAG